MSAEAPINPDYREPTLPVEPSAEDVSDGRTETEPSPHNSSAQPESETTLPSSSVVEEGETQVPPKRNKTGVIVGAVAAGAAVTAGAIFVAQSWLGINKGDSRPSEDPNNPRPTAGAPVTPGLDISPSASPSAEREVPLIPKPDVDTNPAWTKLSPENQKHFMELMDSKNGKEKRAKLSESERLGLSMYIAEYIDEYASDMFEQYNPDYRKPVKASKDNSNQEILDIVSDNRAKAFLLVSGGSPDVYGPNNVKNGWTWLNFAEIYAEGLYASSSNGAANLYQQVSELPNLSNANYTGYPANTANSAKVLDVNGTRSMGFKEIGYYGPDAPNINGEFKLVEYTPFGSPDGAPKKATWITVDLLQGSR